METNKHGYVPIKLLTETGKQDVLMGCCLWAPNDKHEENWPSKLISICYIVLFYIGGLVTIESHLQSFLSMCFSILNDPLKIGWSPKKDYDS